MKTRRLIIQAWPELTSLAGELAMTAIPSFIVSEIATVITGIAITNWSATRIQSKNGDFVLICCSQ